MTDSWEANGLIAAFLAAFNIGERGIQVIGADLKKKQDTRKVHFQDEDISLPTDAKEK